jgi:mannose-1-phosphate guanylyltransferase
MDSGEFFWNSGIFMWNVNAIMQAIHKYLPEISARFDLGIEMFNTPEEQQFVNVHYPYCPNISIDYGIMEKADNVYMKCVDFGWADLGTWGSLYDIAAKDTKKNAVLKTRALLYECEDNIIALGDKKRLAVIQGLKDYIVAESDNVLLICKKEDEQRIKQFMADSQLKYNDEFI